MGSSGHEGVEIFIGVAQPASKNIDASNKNPICCFTFFCFILCLLDFCVQSFCFCHRRLQIFGFLCFVFSNCALIPDLLPRVIEPIDAKSKGGKKHSNTNNLQGNKCERVKHGSAPPV